MNIFYLLIVTHCLSLIWFDVFELGIWLKTKIGYNSWDYVKPYDCYRCTSFWIGVLVSIVFVVFMWTYWGWMWGHLFTAGWFVGSNFIISKIIDFQFYSEITEQDDK